ncbi:MAG: hydrogenase maturation protease, partial [Mycobacteriales bacterium]
VAGLGNIFQADDGFGVAVAAALHDVPMPDGVEVRDFGIRGIHLAYALLDGYDLVVIVDAVSRGEQPGTVYVIEHGADTAHAAAPDGSMLDAHDMDPDEVLALVPRLGGTLGRVVIVGCEPESISAGMGLSPPVGRSVKTAAEQVAALVSGAISPARQADAPAHAGRN